MEALRPVEILEKFRLNFSIDEEQAHQQMMVYKEKITTFEAFLNKTYQQLEVRTNFAGPTEAAIHTATP